MMYNSLVLGTLTPSSFPHEIQSSFSGREAVIAGTHGALEALSSLIVPGATIGVMLYGFNLMYRGVMGGKNAAPKLFS